METKQSSHLIHHLLSAPLASSSSSFSASSTSRQNCHSSKSSVQAHSSARSRAASAPVTVSVSAISAVPILHHHHHLPLHHQPHPQQQSHLQEKPKKPSTQPPMSRRPSSGASTFALVTPLHTHLEHKPGDGALDSAGLPPSPIKKTHQAKESATTSASHRFAASAFHQHHHPQQSQGIDQHQEFHLARDHQPPTAASASAAAALAATAARPDMPRIDSGVGSFATLASLSSTSSLSLSLSACSTTDTAIVSPKLGANARTSSVATIPEATQKEEEQEKAQDADDEHDETDEDDDDDDKFHDARSGLLGLGLFGSSLTTNKHGGHIDFSNPPQLPTPALNSDDLFAEFHLAHSSSSPMHSLTHKSPATTSSSSTSSLLDALADHAPPTPALAPASSTHHLVDSAATSLTSSPNSATSSTAHASADANPHAHALVLPPLHASHPRVVGGVGYPEFHVRPRADREAGIDDTSSSSGFDVDIDDEVSATDSDSESDGEHRLMLRAYTTHPHALAAGPSGGAAPALSSVPHLPQPQLEPLTRSSRSSSMSSTASHKSHASSLAQSIIDAALNFTGFAGLRARAASSKPSATTSSAGSTAGSSPRVGAPGAGRRDQDAHDLSLHVAQAVLAASEAVGVAADQPRDCKPTAGSGAAAAAAAGLPGLFARLGLGGGSAHESKAPSLAHSRSDTCTSFGLLTSDFMTTLAPSATATSTSTAAHVAAAPSAVAEYEPSDAGTGKTAVGATMPAHQVEAHAGSGVPVPPSPTRALLRSTCNDWDAHLATYIDPIFAHLRALETRYRPKRHYMDTLQTAISREMRDNLVDYLVGVRVDLSLSRDSVFLAVNYLDRFLSKRVVTSTTLDSVCLAALLVSTKYEEVAPPDVLDLTRLLEGQFTPDDLLDMERELLTTLAFKLNVATIESFLPLAMAAAGIVNPDPVTTIHVEHVAWMAIADYDVAHMHLASVLAGASVIVAAEVFGAGGAVAHAAAGGSGHRAVVTHEQADQMWDGVCKWLGQDAARELAGAVSGLRRALRKPRMNIQRCTELALRAASKAVEA